MGVLAPGSAHARPSAQPPIDVSGNFPAHLTLKHLPQPLSDVSGPNSSPFPLLYTQNRLFGGRRGVPEINFSLES